jgi:NADH-quinone oxidoreductase subunit J
VVSAAVVLGGAVGVILRATRCTRAVSLVATLFGVAVLFVAQEAHFLAAVQVIVYTGAIVVLFLFVLMLLGVDKAEDLDHEPLVGQRALAVAAGVGVAICVRWCWPVAASFESVLLRPAVHRVTGG